ncbi:MAG TPA: hypothetical protein VKF14_12420 [Candidatus Dormibacteraeota bacterium]|nr:hypothetical protein [Candidatus Dormibacteraeota bacterium]
MSTLRQASDRMQLARIRTRLQQILIFEIAVLLANLCGVFAMIGATYAMATLDGFTGVNLYFGYLSDGSIVAALVAIEVLTLVVAVRTWRMLQAANTGDLPALKKLSSAGWAVIAIFSSYIATGIVLRRINEMTRTLDVEAR